jgi:tripartite-type tricarboxylate transporter receptor subunit TctC
MRPISSLSRRATLAAFGTLLAALLPGQSAHAASWPERPITIVVPYTPGTSIDTLARTIGPKLQQSLGQPVIVETRPGASGNIGTSYAANAAPDGYTLLMTVNTFVMNPSLFKSVPYDPVKSFAPIGQVATGALVFAVNPSMQAATLADAIKALRANPNAAYASPGIGTPQHLAMELFKQQTGVEMQHVPFSGSAGAVTNVVGGQVQAMIMPANTALPFKESGKLKVLAVTQTQRVAVMPDVPTFEEQGVRDANVDLWFGLFAPARTPPELIARLNSEVTRILALPDVQQSLEKQGLTIAPGTPEALGKLVQADLVRWADLIKKAGITAE